MPSDIVKFTLVLPKSRKKQSTVINGLSFREGQATIQGDAKEIAGIVKYFTRSYQVEVQPHGTSQVHSSSESGETDQVPSGVRQDGTGSEEETAVHIGSNARTEPGSSRVGSDRDGHEDTRLSKEDRFNQSQNNQVNPEKLMKVLKGLDPTDDAQWNAVGLPKLNVVGEMYGSEGVTRKDIDAVWPEFHRKMATV